MQAHLGQGRAHARCGAWGAWLAQTRRTVQDCGFQAPGRLWGDCDGKKRRVVLPVRLANKGDEPGPGDVLGVELDDVDRTDRAQGIGGEGVYPVYPRVDEEQAGGATEVRALHHRGQPADGKLLRRRV